MPYSRRIKLTLAQHAVDDYLCITVSWTETFEYCCLYVVGLTGQKTQLAETRSRKEHIDFISVILKDNNGRKLKRQHNGTVSYFQSLKFNSVAFKATATNNIWNNYS
ncbi:hypothetical protein PV326_009969 [Microctonus aethiopoides]|nr:hypothetical protein PV326_009969 [Microctonus aethiopoides]